jgi:hypothetical protein
MVGLGECLYQRLDEPEQLDLYLVGVSNEPGENDDDLAYIEATLEPHTDVSADKIALESYSRDDTMQADIFELDYSDDSLLILPDTYLFSPDSDGQSIDPVDRYSEILERLNNAGLGSVLHTNVDSDLQRVPGNEDGTYAASELARDLANTLTREADLSYQPTAIHSEKLNQTLLLSDLSPF